MNIDIEFSVWENDDSTSIQLEPEAFVFVVHPGNTIKFRPINPSFDFKWTIVNDFKNMSCQLFPEGKYEGVLIFQNDTLNEEWSSLYGS